MNNREALDILSVYRANLINSASDQLNPDIEAFDKAIKALGQADGTQLSAEQIILQKIQSHKTWQWVSVADAEVIKNALRNVPRRGEWLIDMYGDHVCPFCKGTRRDSRSDYINFCNKCGADLRGVQGE